MRTTLVKWSVIIAATLTTATFCKADNTHHGELSSGGSLYFRAEPVNHFMMEGTSSGSELYYYIHLQGIKKDNAQTRKRIPLNLCIVIDRSGSMSGDKIAYTREAVKYIINQLDYRDVLSIVLYDTNVEVFQQAQRLESKQELLNRVSGIGTLNSTNLEGGIRKGFELVKGAKKLLGDEMIHRVLLLSDGLANVGLTDPAALSAITRELFEKDKISISTFGVGTDYSEDLMTKIAVQGGGKYYFIDSPDKMSSIFDQELKGVSQVVAKNTVLKIKYPATLLAYDKTYLYNANNTEGTLELSFNDVFSEEQKAVLIRFKTKEKIKAPLKLECSISYNNSANDSLTAVSDLRSTEVMLTNDRKVYNSGYSRAASEGYALQVTGEVYEDAVQAGNRGDYEGSVKKIKEAKEVLDNHFKNIGEHPFLKDLYNKLDEYEKIIADLKNMDREKASYHIKVYKHKKYRTVSCPAF